MTICEYDCEFNTEAECDAAFLTRGVHPWLNYKSALPLPQTDTSAPLGLSQSAGAAQCFGKAQGQVGKEEAGAQSAGREDEEDCERGKEDYTLKRSSLSAARPSFPRAASPLCANKLNKQQPVSSRDRAT